MRQQSVLNFPNPKAEPAQPTQRPDTWYDFNFDWETGTSYPPPVSQQFQAGQRRLSPAEVNQNNRSGETGSAVR